MADGYAIVDPEGVAAEAFPESGHPHRKLTGSLGCTELRVNAVTLGPGEALSAHRHERQEEVYVCLSGPGYVEVDGTVEPVPAGGVVRVDPAVERRLLNRDDEGTAEWLMFGAPPVGSVDDFGGYVVDGDA